MTGGMEGTEMEYRWIEEPIPGVFPVQHVLVDGTGQAAWGCTLIHFEIDAGSGNLALVKHGKTGWQWQTCERPLKGGECATLKEAKTALLDAVNP